MPTRSRQDLLISIAVLALFVGMLMWSQTIASLRGREFPVLVSATAIVLCLLDVVSHTDTPFGRTIAIVLAGTVDQTASALGHTFRREAMAVAWIAGAVALIVLAGFLVAIPVYVFGYMLLYARRSVREGAITALATTVCIWIGFELLLHYELYRGIFAGI